MAPVEAEAETAFPGSTVAVVPLSQPVADVIMDHAVVHKCPIPVKGLPGFESIGGINLVSAIVGDAFDEIGRIREERVDWKRGQNGLRVNVAYPARDGAGSGSIVRHAIINVGCKIERRIVLIGNPHGFSRRVGGGETVAEQSPVDLGRDDRRVDGVARDFVPIDARIAHGQGGPVSGIFESWIWIAGCRGIGDDLGGGLGKTSRDVSSRQHYLIVQLHGSDASGIGDLGRDGEGLTGWRHFRTVIHLTDLRRGIGGEDTVFQTRSRRACRGPPTASQLIVQARMDQLHGRALPASGYRPGEFRGVVHLVHDGPRGIEECQVIGIAGQRTRIRPHGPGRGSRGGSIEMKEGIRKITMVIGVIAI